MSFPELVEALKQLPIDEVRTHTETHFECVFKNENLKQLTPALNQFFGAPKKPAGESTSGEIADLASDFGGVLRNQTLYYMVQDGFSHLGMIWPWSNGTTSTLKIFKLKFST